MGYKERVSNKPSLQELVRQIPEDYQPIAYMMLFFAANEAREDAQGLGYNGRYLIDSTSWLRFFPNDGRQSQAMIGESVVDSIFYRMNPNWFPRIKEGIYSPLEVTSDSQTVDGNIWTKFQYIKPILQANQALNQMRDTLVDAFGFTENNIQSVQLLLRGVDGLANYQISDELMHIVAVRDTEKGVPEKISNVKKIRAGQTFLHSSTS